MLYFSINFIYDIIKIKELKKLSKYILENSEETIDEAFCDYYYYLNKEKAQNITKKIVKVVKE